MSMTRNLGVALAFTVVVAVGALGYIAGGNLGRGPAATNVDVNALMREAIASRIKATPIGGTDFQAVELSDDQRIEVQDIIKNYLIANPEIVRDAMNALQIREDATAKAAQTMAIADNSELIFDSNREVVLGNPRGKTTLVEFFDYNCAYCRAAHQDMLDLMAKDPDVRVVLKEFPVLGDGSVQAAQVGVAVHLVAPDKYFAFHDALIREKGQIDGERALAIAGEVGVD